jgi:hypothetical protein
MLLRTRPENLRCRIALIICVLAAPFISLRAAPRPRAQTARYVGTINRARADALLSFEKMRDYTLVSGQIKSARFTYSFTADVYGESGFGTMTDRAAGTRFPIKLIFSQAGFTLISNPLGPGTPTPYEFKLVK